MGHPRTISFNYTHGSTYPIDILYGVDAISALNTPLEQMACSRAMIVCGPNTLKSGVVERVEAALGELHVGTFDGVGQHVPAESMSAAGELAREVEPDVIISVGGGSAHDTSKALAMMLAGGGDIHEYDRFAGTETPQEARQRLPIIAVPTTIACAEISPGGGGTVTDKELGRKWSFSGEPGHRVVVVDGQALATTPERILLSTAMSQFRIAAECICAPSHDLVGDALSVHGIRKLVELVPQCHSRDPEVLAHTKVAACLPSLARFHAKRSQGISTAICHQAGGLLDIPHGDVHGIMLPHALRFNLPVTASRQVLIAQAMGVDTSGLQPEEAGEAGAKAFERFCQMLGNPTRLRDVGVSREAVREIAEATFKYESAIETNPRPITGVQDIETILYAAW